MVKLDTGDYPTLLDIQKSDSSCEAYQIRWDVAKGHCCSCMGWASSKRRPKTCKHIKRFGFKAALMSGTNLDNEVIEIVLETAKEIWAGVI